MSLIINSSRNAGFETLAAAAVPASPGQDLAELQVPGAGISSHIPAGCCWDLTPSVVIWGWVLEVIPKLSGSILTRPAPRAAACKTSALNIYISFIHYISQL